ncbi:MAG: 50S ribosomal protein L11 methyltransferase [Gammaproteobacteria bacterium]|nr:50S ribosomal protein L11 methyltransferase [Gammaproteobacteria bacterium]
MNTQDWLEIKLETTEQYDTDSLEEALFAAGALSVTLTSKVDEVILIEPTPGELPLWEQGIIVTGLFDQGFDISTALPIIKACLNTDNPPIVASEILANRQWELEWTKYFHPIQFGKDLWICPSNKQVATDKITDNTQIITLDPGLAFGTGTHPTTAMALEYIATHQMTDKHCIDFGCGSGVLGIAALKMEAKQVIMTDIDPQALTTTKSNATINEVADNIECYLPDKMPTISTDFLIANILLEPLLMLKDTFVSHCHKDTVILLTGLLKEQVPQIIEKYEQDFTSFNITESGDWAMVVTVRKL